MLHKTRTLSALFAATAAALVLAGCAGGPADGTDSGDDSAAGSSNGLSLQEVKDAGKLVVATEGTYRPFSYHEDGSGDLTGYDVEIITAVADKLGVDVEFQETQWDAIFAGLEAGRFDLIANQVSINDERTAKYDFSEPYTISPGVLIVPEGSAIASFDDLAGKTTAQSLTSNWYDIAEGAGATVEPVEGWAQAVELVKQGRVDATVNDELTFLDAKKNGDTDGLKIAAESDDVSTNAFALRKGSDDLVDAINAALDELRADGTLAEISDKYFGEDVSE
ncbi:amino acid ABC transporter substrate-binding protein [Amnibacterium flavum]|uniref:Polar amino acid ABC transporter substrate-binding protein n=1 Tax=Amnibacterium flavum TaxID=2173173 RepID=A0A2V1HU42_9MICO|nr:amino acid ABC transporter substrate-binding protein [Amnibacterium flavum]PVZ94559.1 polar amino acid ABC transporter substrate-binding protein [Amnibacterium flavum]